MKGTLAILAILVALGAAHPTAMNTSEIEPRADSCACNADRIVGGKKARKGQFPWQVGIASSGSVDPWCGGTLLSEDWVLTAAHCVENVVSTTQIQVILGAHDVVKNKPKAKVRSVAEIIMHEDYDTFTTNNDVALLKLASPITCGKRIAGACLAPVEPEAGSKVTVSGWGSLKYQGNSPSKLMFVNVDVIDKDKCNDWYGGTIDDNTMICAGLVKGGKDSCQGDSGGPLVLKGTNELVGVVSFGFKCAEPKAPGVYASVAHFYNWIVENCDNCTA